MLSIVSTVVYAGFTWLLHREPSRRAAPGQPAAPDILEAILIAAALLVVRRLPLRVLGQSGWLGTYLLFGLIAPVVLESMVHRRPLTFIGFRRPSNGRAVAIAFSLLAIYGLSALYRVFVWDTEYYFDWGRIGYYAEFAYVEEVLFRGLIQSRLESACGEPRSWLLSGLFFGFYHWYGRYLVPGRALMISGVLQLASTTAFGVFLGALFAKTRSLLPPLLVHLANNLYASRQW